MSDEPSEEEARRQRTDVCRMVFVGGSLMVIAMVTVALLLWGFRWPPSVVVVSQIDRGAESRRAITPACDATLAFDAFDAFDGGGSAWNRSV